MSDKKTDKKWLILLAAVVVVGVLLLCAVLSLRASIRALTVPTNVSAQGTATDAETLVLTVNGMEVSLTLDGKDAVLDCPTLNTEFETELVCEDTTHEIIVNDEPMVDGRSAVTLDSLNKKEFITVLVDGVRYRLRTLPSDYPTFIAVGKSSQDGYFYSTGSGYAFKLDSSGDTVFYRACDSESAGPFRRSEIDGEVIYSYLEHRSFIYPKLDGVGYNQNVLVMMDEQYRVIEEVPCMATTDAIPEGYPLENHDYQILERGHYILTTYIGKHVDNIPTDVDGWEFGANVVAYVIQEVKNGECIFEWNSTDFPELYGASLEAGDYTNATSVWADYVHGNAVSIDPADNNLVVSMRNVDAILKIDRTTGDILWVLGGKLDQFGLNDEQQFHRQHNVTITEDGSYLLFDNGCLQNVLGYPKLTDEEIAYAAENEYSRVVKVKLDEVNKTIVDFKDYSVEKLFTSTMGSAQILDDESETILIGWGSRKAKGLPIFSEVNFQDKSINFELFDSGHTLLPYRVMHFDA